MMGEDMRYSLIEVRDIAQGRLDSCTCPPVKKQRPIAVDAAETIQRLHQDDPWPEQSAFVVGWAYAIESLSRLINQYSETETVTAVHLHSMILDEVTVQLCNGLLAR